MTVAQSTMEPVREAFYRVCMTMIYPLIATIGLAIYAALLTDIPYILVVGLAINAVVLVAGIMKANRYSNYIYDLTSAVETQLNRRVEKSLQQKDKKK
jgi:hypothetical protein